MIIFHTGEQLFLMLGEFYFIILLPLGLALKPLYVIVPFIETPKNLSNILSLPIIISFILLTNIKKEAFFTFLLKHNFNLKYNNQILFKFQNLKKGGYGNFLLFILFYLFFPIILSFSKSSYFFFTLVFSF